MSRWGSARQSDLNAFVLTQGREGTPVAEVRWKGWITQLTSFGRIKGDR